MSRLFNSVFLLKVSFYKQPGPGPSTGGRRAAKRDEDKKDGAPESAPPVKGLPKERRHGVSRGGRRAGEGPGPVP